MNAEFSNDQFTNSEFVPVQSSIINRNYLVKINEDYKVITNNYLEENKLKKMFDIYYPDSQVEFTSLSNYDFKLIESLFKLLTSDNSFLKYDIEPLHFMQNLNSLNSVVKYFRSFDSSLNIFGSDSTLKESVKSSNENSEVGFKLVNVSRETRSVRDIIEKDNKTDSVLDVEGVERINNYQLIEKFDSSLLEHSEEYNIYFNSQFNNIFIIRVNSDYFNSNKIKSLFPEFKLVSKIIVDIDSNKQKQLFEMKQDIYVNQEDAKNRLDKIMDDKNINTKLSFEEIKNLINKYFDIDTNPEHCFKFSTIFNIISSNFNVSESYINYLKRQLPMILSEMGLQKKRMSDGIYWYGLTKKELNNKKEKELPTKVKVEPIPQSDFDNLLDKLAKNRAQQIF
jgi:hypothetical protein